MEDLQSDARQEDRIDLEKRSKSHCILEHNCLQVSSEAAEQNYVVRQSRDKDNMERNKVVDEKDEVEPDVVEKQL